MEKILERLGGSGLILWDEPEVDCKWMLEKAVLTVMCMIGGPRQLPPSCGARIGSTRRRRPAAPPTGSRP